MQSQQQSALSKRDAEENFGKAFAKSLSNKNLRQLIKNKALEKFDNDYDVLYASIKEVEIEKGKTVEQLIESNYDKGIDKDVLASVPTLTIFVPNLQFFNAEKWDVNNTLPQVAIAHATSDKRNEKITTFSSTGAQTYLNYLKKPTTSTIVIKENERVDVIKIKQNPSSIYLKYKDEVFENNKYLTALKNSGNNKINLISFSTSDVPSLKEMSITNTRISSSVVKLTENERLYPDSQIGYAAKYGINQRDYAYYGIDPTSGKDTGLLNANYAEYIRSIEMENRSSLGFISDNWTDGDLELYFTIFLLPRDSSSPSVITKFASVPIASLDTIVYNSTTRPHPQTLLAYSGAPFPIKITNWNNYKYGSTWKISVYEYDPGDETTVTNTITSTYTTNFKNSTSVDLLGTIKIGNDIGGSDSETKTQTTSYKSTNTSDQLGDVLINYDDPVCFLVNNRPPQYKANIVSTGGIKLRIEPLLINNP